MQNSCVINISTICKLLTCSVENKVHKVTHKQQRAPIILNNNYNYYFINNNNNFYL